MYRAGKQIFEAGIFMLEFKGKLNLIRFQYLIKIDYDL